ncbi:MAG: carnitine dehydratase [Actinomycetia bacterium]|nr:carnitine dehydratase [Actinomycetes bacterium]
MADPDDATLPVSHPTPPPPDRPGPMAGIRVIELAHPFGAFAGRLLADAGADVIVVEPPGGAAQRTHAPFADNESGLERSLAWWAENTSKRSIVADLDTNDGQALVRRLVATADVFLECEHPGRLVAVGLGYDDLSVDHPDLIHVAITPFGQAGVGGSTDVTDLTLLARGGPMWSCGYDDHDLPPVRGRGNQSYRMASHFAVMSILTALLARRHHGGQFVDVNVNAAANVTTEFASYGWLAGQQTVQRQTGRHATPTLSEPTQFRCADGRYLNTGVPPRSGGEFKALLEWMRELGLEDEFALTSILELGFDYELITLTMIEEDPLVGEVFGAGREAMAFIAANVSAHEAFLGFQQRGIAAGVVWSPDEMMADPHFVERGFPTEIHHDEIGRSVTYPGAPIRFTASPMSISPAPRLGEHTDQILAELEGG